MFKKKKINCIIEVVGFNNLLVDHAEIFNAQVIIRGLRAVADFEYEFQLAGMNRKLNEKIETIFLMSDVDNQVISSRLVKEIATLNGAKEEQLDITPIDKKMIKQALVNCFMG